MQDKPERRRRGRRRRKLKWRKVRAGTKPFGNNEEQRRVDRRENEFSEVLSRLEVLGDPFNDMNIEDKKRHALFLFYDRIKVFSLNFI